MTYYSLGRQEKGKLAEVLVTGLFGDIHEQVEEVILDHLDERYHELVADASVRISQCDLNSYRWTDEIPLSVPADIGWRPDFFVKADWYRSFERYEPVGETMWEPNLPPNRWWIHAKRVLYRDLMEELRCSFTVYYPVEVKSGDKKTLTEQQASTIPKVVNHVDHVHPLIATININELPAGYSLDVEEFSTSGWGSDTSRYRSD